ncbi:hypothetical protein [Spirosoma pulveris]
MTPDELYDKLCDKGFREFQTGDLFSRYYVYLYPPDQEYLDILNMTVS